LKQKEWSETDYNLYHYRDAGGLEVDLVVELENSRIILIEIKSSSTHKYENFKNIINLSKKLGSKFHSGFVITTAGDVQTIGNNMWSIPANLLWGTKTSSNP
jgi:predicted AAA+ superfamily ATPase